MTSMTCLAVTECHAAAAAAAAAEASSASSRTSLNQITLTTAFQLHQLIVVGVARDVWCTVELPSWHHHKTLPLELLLSLAKGQLNDVSGLI